MTAYKKPILGAVIIIFAGMFVLSRLTGNAGEKVGHVSEKQPEAPLSVVGFSCMKTEPTDEDIPRLVDDAITQILGSKGLSAIIKKGDHVVIKVNLVGPHRGAFGEKGRGIITDPRIVRHVADKVRDIIGFDSGADLKVIDGIFYRSKTPSLKSEQTSFYYARLERTGDNNVDREDYCYDYDADGFLDGKSKAELVNADSIPLEERFLTEIKEPYLGNTKVFLPKFLRTRKQAHGEKEYCDVFIGLPLLKNHAFTGMTGALKLHYGLHNLWGDGDDKGGRINHAGYGWATGDIRLFLDYLCAMNRARGYDLVIMDCLTGNRRGPVNVYEPSIDMKADYIKVNAVLCSRDSVAIDTVETLLAGYLPGSVPLLESADRDGIGTCRPERIDLCGYDMFLTHKKYLRETNSDPGGEKYPFENGWGNTQTHQDFSPPANLSVVARRVKGSVYEFSYNAEDSGQGDLGLARIDLLIDGKRVAYSTKDLSKGTFSIDMKKYLHARVHYRIAAWDKALNCGLSSDKNLIIL